MYVNKDVNSKIPMLKRNEYTQWRVKMMHHLRATYIDYLNMIKDGPFVPSKLVPAMNIDGKVFEEHLVEKSKDEWTKEDKENILKDAKVINILFNSLDSVLTNYMLSCKTTIEVWNRLQVHYEGTKPMKKNMKYLLIQGYEYIKARSRETLTETYDMFTKLLNDMAMHDKYYDNEDVNTKFIRSFPEMYDKKTTAIREANDPDKITLEDVYGKLRAYELEKQQRKGRGEGKPKSVAMMIQDKKERITKDQSRAK